MPHGEQCVTLGTEDRPGVGSEVEKGTAESEVKERRKLAASGSRREGHGQREGAHSEVCWEEGLVPSGLGRMRLQGPGQEQFQPRGCRGRDGGHCRGSWRKKWGGRGGSYRGKGLRGRGEGTTGGEAA